MSHNSSDVVVVGGGLAGKAASLQLARAGLSVICIEPEETVRQAVGESLDWSAPDLLNALGLPAIGNGFPLLDSFVLLAIPERSTNQAQTNPVTRRPPGAPASAGSIR